MGSLVHDWSVRESQQRTLTIRLVAHVYRRHLESLNDYQLLQLSAALEAEQMAHTIDLFPTRDSLIDALVKFREWELYGYRLEELSSMLDFADFPA